MTINASTLAHEESAAVETAVLPDAAASAPVPATTASTAAASGPAIPEPAAGSGAAEPAGRENAFAITSFVLGICSVVSGWTFIAPIIGLVFGVLALRRKTSERTLALWGVWLNVAMLALAVIAVGFFLLVLGFGFVAGMPYLEI